MIKRYFTVLAFLLWPALFLGLPQAFSLEREENREISGNTLNRLIEISSQLSTLNEKLQSELQDSRQNSSELQIMLEASKQELGSLRQELEVLRNNSTELLNRAESSQMELIMLQTALKKADSSLTSLEISFAAYREAVERKISGLEREARFWKWGAVAAGILAAGFGGALILGR